jgi:zinc transport system ATP-binding protein
LSGGVLDVKGLTVRFDSSTVLEGVNLQVEQGDVVGIVGPNGGGKTTLLNAILGIVPAAEGSIRLFGQDISEFNNFERVGYVSQNAIQFDPIFPATVREIVALGCVKRSNMGRLLKASDWEDVDSAIKTVGLSGLSDRKISELSGGQKQRIFIARALVKKPRLLILDEAAAGLDVCIQDQFVQILRHLRSEEEMTILTVSHDLSGVMCQANKLAVVNRKVYVTDITPTTDPTPILREAYGHHFTFIFHHDHESCQGV